MVAFLACNLLAQGRRPQKRAVAVKPAAAAAVPSNKAVFWGENANPHAYALFANGGWDGNWFVGYGTAWITKVPPPPKGNYARAFIGARLGRMKTEAVPGRPSWERKPIAGEINISIAPEPVWPESKRLLLTRTDRIPLEGEAGDAIEGVGASRWFWVEVPLGQVSFDKDNYITLFSPSANLKDVRTSPILAAAPGDKRANSWLVSNAQGGPPSNPEEALKTAVSFFDPAIALKLVGESTEPVAVSWTDAKKSITVEDRAVVSARVAGSEIQEAWLEISAGGNAWRAAGSAVSGAPYVFTINRDWFPSTGKYRVRAAAVNVWHKTAYSPALTVHAAPPADANKK